MPPAHVTNAPVLPVSLSRRRKWSFQPYLLILPSAVILLLFTVWPMMLAVFDSLLTAEPTHQTRLRLGFGNYLGLVQDPVFWQVMKNTTVFILVTVPVSIVLAMVLAVLVNRQFRLTPLFRMALFHPVVLPMVSAASIWLFMFTPGYGVVDSLLRVVGGEQINWLGQPGTAMLAVIVMSVWKETGLFMVFYLAGLQNIGTDPYEAAAVDGGGGIRTFTSVTFPLLMPTTMFVSVVAIVNAFQMVDQLYVMTQGGPANATNMLLYYVYQQAFSFQNLGKASAMSVILIVVLVVFAILQQLIDKRVHYS